MLTWSVSKQEEGRRLDRFLMKLFPKAPLSLIYKALRTKTVKLNGKKGSPADRLQEGDMIQIFFSDVRAAELGYPGTESSKEVLIGPDFPVIPIIYEDQRILIFNKPAGVLSQKDTAQSISLSEYLLQYLSREEEYDPRQSMGFRPGICNRLDRNTSGIVVAAKTLSAAQAVNAAIRTHQVEKVYLAICQGDCFWTEERLLVHRWLKDPAQNRVQLEKYIENTEYREKEKHTGSDTIACRAQALATNPQKHLTLFRLQLITGKSHQLRAQLAFEGFPILGDHKYGGEMSAATSFHIKHQLLHAYQFRLCHVSDSLLDLTGRTFTATPSDEFQRILKNTFPNWFFILSDSGENNV